MQPRKGKKTRLLIWQVKIVHIVEQENMNSLLVRNIEGLTQSDRFKDVLMRRLARCPVTEKASDGAWKHANKKGEEEHHLAPRLPNQPLESTYQFPLEPSKVEAEAVTTPTGTLSKTD